MGYRDVPYSLRLKVGVVRKFYLKKCRGAVSNSKYCKQSASLTCCDWGVSKTI